MDGNEIFKILLSLLLGGLLGFERQYRAKAAGFRTIIIICIGTTLFTLLSTRFGWGDPSRLAAGIVTGIGFLGAGAIIRYDKFISGLTTAATIWFTAALGISIGLGYYLLSTFTAFIVLIVLGLLPIFEKIIEKFTDITIYEFEIDNLSFQISEIEHIIKQYKLKIIELQKEKENLNLIITLKLKGKKSNLNLFGDELIKKEFIQKLKIR